MTVELSAEARARLDGHLDEVEKALMAGGRSREQRRAVVDDLEAQILDMLAKRSAAPTLGDMNEVLAQVDPPSAYSEGAPREGAAPDASKPVMAAAVKAQERPRYSGFAIAGFVCILVSLIPVLFVVPVVAAKTAQRPPLQERVMVPTSNFIRDPVTGERKQEMIEVAPEMNQRAPAPEAGRAILGSLICVIVPLGPLALAGTVFGWIAYGQIRRSNGMIRGKGLALFDGLFYPVLLLLVPLLVMG
jgi:hypothetical protein